MISGVTFMWILILCRINSNQNMLVLQNNYAICKNMHMNDYKQGRAQYIQLQVKCYQALQFVRLCFCPGFEVICPYYLNFWIYSKTGVWS